MKTLAANLLFSFFVLLLASPAVVGAVGSTVRVSVNSNGEQALGGGIYETQLFPTISGDGRYVAFISDASNLVPNDVNNYFDVFVHDRQTHITTRVNVDSKGTPAPPMASIGGCGAPDNEGVSLSADGRYVAFASLASNLVSGDTNGCADVFVHDNQTGKTTRVSVNSLGDEGTAGASHPTLSADGRYVAFASGSRNLVANDNNDSLDVFVHDQQTQITTRVSVNSAG